MAQAFLIGEDFFGCAACTMMLCRCIIYGNGFSCLLWSAVGNVEKWDQATIFWYYVNDPERFGVVTFDESGKESSIKEKLKEPKSNRHHGPLLLPQGGDIDRTALVKPSDWGNRRLPPSMKCT